MNKGSFPGKAAIVFLSICIAIYVFHSMTSAKSQMVKYSLDFGSSGIPENPGIEILDFKYGSSNKVGTVSSPKRPDTGRIDQAGGVYGLMPAGDILYVKWRVISSGKIFEDTVNLKDRVPYDMEHKIVHFAVKDSQLIVYVIEGNSKNQLHAQGAADCPPPEYTMLKCTRIYPDHWASF